MNTEQARLNMVEQQIRPWDVLDQEVLDLLYLVRREEFVPEAYRALCFSDLEIPLGEGAYMMQPKLEARILQELAVGNTERVLDVGTGSAYLAALLAHRAQHVHTVEINARLAQFGAANLRKASIGNVTVEQGDGARGWPALGPFDIVVLGGSIPLIPAGLLSQLKTGGRMFAVVGDPPVMSARLITCVAPGSFNTVDLFETMLAPLENCAQPERFEF